VLVVGGAGVLLYHFGTLTPTACLWTPVVFPVVAIILGVGFFQIVLSMLLPTIAMGLGVILEATSNLLAGMVELIAHIDHSQIVIGKVSLTIVIIYYLGLFVWRFERLRKPIVKQSAVAIAICLMILPAFIGGLSKDIARCLEITCLDVGHGQAIVVSLPNGHNFLLDAGSLTRKNCGNRIVVPFLKDKGIGHLDGVFVSHDDIDHLNGLPELLASVDAKGVYVNDGFMVNAQTRSSGGFFRQWLEKNDHKLEPLERGLKRTGSARITAIWPDKETCLDESISDNDKSQVLLIEYGGRRVLICSDIEMFAQGKILAENPDLKADVVIMPHHGSKTNLIEHFFRQLDAEILIGSCSESRYANAHKEKTTDNYFTAVDGAITIRIEKNGQLSVDRFRNKKLTGYTP